MHCLKVAAMTLNLAVLATGTSMAAFAQTNTNDNPNSFSNLTELYPASGQVFMITHADLVWDRERTSMQGITNAILKLQPSMPVVLLSDTADSAQHFLLPYVQFLHQSVEGEFRFKISAKKYYLAGGFTGAHLDQTKESILKQWNPITTPTLELNYITAGIFGRSQFFKFLPDSIQTEYEDLLSQDGKINYFTLSDFLAFIETQPNGTNIRNLFIINWLTAHESLSLNTRYRLADKNIEVRKDGTKILQYRKQESETAPTIIINLISTALL